MVSGLIVEMRSFITSTLYWSMVASVAMSCRLMFVSETVSWSTMSILPMPLRAKASIAYPPTPPTPKTITCACWILCSASLPMTRCVLEKRLIIALPRSLL